MSLETARVPLTGGNIRNHHFYVKGCLDLFPGDAVGGDNKAARGTLIEVQFKPGSKVSTDIDGDKTIFRDRKAVREFFELSAAEEGDIVVTERTAPRSFEVRLEQQPRS